MATPNISVAIFQEARNRVEQEIGTVIECLNNKKYELFTEIGRLEKEFLDKQQEQQTSLNELKSLKTHTEYLRQNNFKKMQSKVMKELNKGLQKLKLEIENRRNMEYHIDIKWGMCIPTLLSQIAESEVDMSPRPEIDPLSSNLSPIQPAEPLPLLVDYDLIPYGKIPRI